MVSSTEGSTLLKTGPTPTLATPKSDVTPGNGVDDVTTTTANNNSYPPSLPLKTNGAGGGGGGLFKKINGEQLINAGSPQISEKSVSPLRLSESENEDEEISPSTNHGENHENLDDSTETVILENGGQNLEERVKINGENKPEESAMEISDKDLEKAPRKSGKNKKKGKKSDTEDDGPQEKNIDTSDSEEDLEPQLTNNIDVKTETQDINDVKIEHSTGTPEDSITIDQNDEQIDHITEALEDIKQSEERLELSTSIEDSMKTEDVSKDFGDGIKEESIPDDEMLLADVEYLQDDEQEVLLSEKTIREAEQKSKLGTTNKISGENIADEKDLLECENEASDLLEVQEDGCLKKQSDLENAILVPSDKVKSETILDTTDEAMVDMEDDTSIKKKNTLSVEILSKAVEGLNVELAKEKMQIDDGVKPEDISTEQFEKIEIQPNYDEMATLVAVPNLDKDDILEISDNGSSLNDSAKLSAKEVQDISCEDVVMSVVSKADVLLDRNHVEQVEDQTVSNVSDVMDVDVHVIEDDDAPKSDAVITTQATNAAQTTNENSVRNKRPSEVFMEDGITKKPKLVNGSTSTDLNNKTEEDSNANKKSIRTSMRKKTAAVPSAKRKSVDANEADDDVTVILDDPDTNSSPSTIASSSAADDYDDDRSSDGADQQQERKKDKKVLKMFEKVQQSMKGMSRRELELFLSAKIVDAFEASSSLAKHKDMIRAQQEKLLRLEATAAQLRKQMQDIDHVHNKAVNQLATWKRGSLPPPPYITRSVGLQVTISGPSLAAVRSAHPNPGSGTGTGNATGSVGATHSTNVSRRSTGSQSSTSSQNHQNRKSSPRTNNVNSSNQQRRSPPQQQTRTSNNAVGTNNRNSPMAQQQQQQQQQLPPQPVNIIRNLNAAPPESMNPRGVTIDLTDEEDRPANVNNTNRFDPTKQPIYLLPQNGQNVIIATPQNTGTIRPNTTTLMIRSLNPNGTNTIQAANGLIYQSAPAQRALLPPPSNGLSPTAPPPLAQTGTGGSGGQRRSSLPVRAARTVSSPAAHHPAPLPRPDNGVTSQQQQQQRTRRLPARPAVKISQVAQGIVISWTMPDETPDHPEVASYQIYAYQETDVAPTADLWRKVGDVKAMPLPMACTLTQFTFGNRYHFAVRAVDVNSHIGPFSVPNSILLVVEHQ